MSLMSSERFALGIDIGGTHLRMGLISPSGELFCPEKQSSSVLAGNDPTTLLGDIILDYMCRNGTKKQVVAICIGFPATVDKARETVLSAPNVQGFDGVPVGRLLSARLGLPVQIERDVNLLLLDDLKKLRIQSVDVVACYVGTGIGNAILGSLLAWALGHIPFGDESVVCGCGNAGCAEALVGGLYLAKLCRETFAGSPIEELFTRHGGHPLLTQYVERLGRVITTEINLIDPETVLLGGGVLQMRGFPIEKLKKCILAHVRNPLPHNNLTIYSSVATDGVTGAGILAWRHLTS